MPVLAHDRILYIGNRVRTDYQVDPFPDSIATREPHRCVELAVNKLYFAA